MSKSKLKHIRVEIPNMEDGKVYDVIEKFPVNYDGSLRPAIVIAGDSMEVLEDINCQFTDEDWEIFLELNAEDLANIAVRYPVLYLPILSELSYRDSNEVWNGKSFGECDNSWGIAYARLATQQEEDI